MAVPQSRDPRTHLSVFLGEQFRHARAKASFRTIQLADADNNPRTSRERRHGR